MIGNRSQELDLVAELRLRQWARRNYVAALERRDTDWHPIVMDEMRQADRDREVRIRTQEVVTSTGVVPLEPSRHDGIRIDQPHAGIPVPCISHPARNHSDVETGIPYYA